MSSKLLPFTPLRRIVYMLALFPAALILASCNEEEVGGGVDEELWLEDASRSVTVLAGCEGCSWESPVFRAGDNWEARVVYDTGTLPANYWLSIDRNEGKKGKQSLQLTAVPNETDQSRTALVQVTSRGQTIYMAFLQPSHGDDGELVPVEDGRSTRRVLAIETNRQLLEHGNENKTLFTYDSKGRVAELRTRRTNGDGKTGETVVKYTYTPYRVSATVGDGSRVLYGYDCIVSNGKVKCWFERDFNSNYKQIAACRLLFSKEANLTAMMLQSRWEGVMADFDYGIEWDQNSGHRSVKSIKGKIEMNNEFYADAASEALNGYSVDLLWLEYVANGVAMGRPQILGAIGAYGRKSEFLPAQGIANGNNYSWKYSETSLNADDNPYGASGKLTIEAAGSKPYTTVVYYE